MDRLSAFMVTLSVGGNAIGTGLAMSHRGRIVVLEDRPFDDRIILASPPRRLDPGLIRFDFIEDGLPPPGPLFGNAHERTTPQGKHKGKLQAPIELRAVSVYRGGPTRAKSSVQGPQREHTWRARRGRRINSKRARRS